MCRLMCVWVRLANIVGFVFGLSGRAGKSMIPFHAIWGLCWYDFLIATAIYNGFWIQPKRLIFTDIYSVL